MKPFCRTSIKLDEPIPGCKFFYWYEFLYLPSWDAHVFPEHDLIRANIIKTATVLDKIRAHFNRPIKVTSGYRPKMYNDFISGATFSSHISGRAVDFQVKNRQASDVRAELVKMLDDLDIRLENHSGDWNHIDLDVNKSQSRFFKP